MRRQSSDRGSARYSAQLGANATAGPLNWGNSSKWSYGDSNSRPLACHADPVSRFTSEGVERGATHLRELSDWVAVSPSVPEHGGSRFWLPCPLRTGQGHPWQIRSTTHPGSWPGGPRPPSPDGCPAATAWPARRPGALRAAASRDPD